jgi:hypothetical protein
MLSESMRTLSFLTAVEAFIPNANEYEREATFGF